METSLMVMYEDESVEVRYGSGAQVQLSPCGCEFMLVKPAEPSGHPLQPSERLRQRTRFTISAYKELMVAALVFRNKYASRPYLPEELIPADHKKPYFSIDSDVQWPDTSCCDAELGLGGETTVRSEDGRAALMLLPSGEEFSVEFVCSLSRTQNQNHSMDGVCRDSEGSRDCQQQVSNIICQTASDETEEGSGSKRNESVRSKSPRMTSTAQPKAEGMYQSTSVVQHHSCRSVAPIWRYPLSLARHLRSARLSKPDGAAAEGAGDLTEEQQRVNLSDVERRSLLLQALPLTCPSPHWHRWKYKDLLSSKEHSDQDLHPTELVKVMLCHGVTYRILSGVVPVVEVSPGDGSIIRSNGVLNTYFTHHKPELLSGQVTEVTYHLSNLPPDVPGQPYSINSVVSRASRILTCYNEAKQSLKLPAAPSCLQEVKKVDPADITAAAGFTQYPSRHLCKSAMTEENMSNTVPAEQHVNVSMIAESRSDLVAAELEKIQRFNFLLENSHLLGSKKGCAELESSPAAETHDAVNEICIAEAVQRTSKAIQDIDALISAATLT